MQISFYEDTEKRKRLTEKKREEDYYEKDCLWFWKVSEQHTQKPSIGEVPMHFPPQLIRNSSSPLLNSIQKRHLNQSYCLLKKMSVLSQVLNHFQTLLKYQYHIYYS